MTPLKPQFKPMLASPNVLRVITTEERTWGLVWRDDKNYSLWVNGRGDGRRYSSRDKAARDLIERPQ